MSSAVPYIAGAIFGVAVTILAQMSFVVYILRRWHSENKD